MTALSNILAQELQKWVEHRPSGCMHGG